MRPLVLAAVLASACADDPGALDRETLAGLARARGDAQGSSFAGRYSAQLEIGECDCPDDLALAVCLARDLAEAVPVMIDITEGDGFMVARFDQVPQLELSGAIDEDGTATLGSVFVSFAIDSDVLFLGRFDATFGEDGELVGHASLRAEGKLAGVPISCGADTEVDAVRQ